MAVLHRLGQTDLRRTKPGMYGDGGGLWLQVTKGTAGHANRSWVFRFGRNGKRREMGLGPVHITGLKAAREKAAELRKLVYEGHDPIEQRNTARAVQAATAAKAITFDECAAAYARAHSPKWTPKHAMQWGVSLAKHASPIFAKLPVSEIDTSACPESPGANLAREAGNGLAHTPAHRGRLSMGHSEGPAQRRQSSALGRAP